MKKQALALGCLFCVLGLGEKASHFSPYRIDKQGGHFVLPKSYQAGVYKSRLRPASNDRVYPNVPIPVQALTKIFYKNNYQRVDDRMRAEVEAYINDKQYQAYMDGKIASIVKTLTPNQQEAFKGKKFLNIVNDWKAAHPDASPTQLALSLAVLEVGGPSALGRLESDMCYQATEYAKYTAKTDNRGQDGGHIGFGGRKTAMERFLAQKRKSGTWDENEAVSSDDLGDSIMEHAMECVRGWMNSAGHRAKMMRFHSRHCHDMRRTLRGAYRCVAQWSDDAPSVAAKQPVVRPASVEKSPASKE